MQSQPVRWRVHAKRRQVLRDQRQRRRLHLDERCFGRLARPQFHSLCASCKEAQAALDVATAHAKSRTIAGDSGPLAHYQSVRFTLAEMALKVQGARLMLHRAAWFTENQPKEAALQMTGAKCVASEAAAAVARQALRMRLLRDAQAGSLMAFTPDQARDMLGKSLTGMDPR
jgi:alkylation response protein AidB-like acyl-CoA dehydrogenase